MRSRLACGFWVSDNPNPSGSDQSPRQGSGSETRGASARTGSETRGGSGRTGSKTRGGSARTGSEIRGGSARTGSETRGTSVRNGSSSETSVHKLGDLGRTSGDGASELEDSMGLRGRFARLSTGGFSWRGGVVDHVGGPATRSTSLDRSAPTSPAICCQLGGDGRLRSEGPGVTPSGLLSTCDAVRG